MPPTAGPLALDGALAWADQALAHRGLVRTGPAEGHLDRPWSTVWRLPLGESACWLKANAAACAYEGAVLRLLAEAEIPHVLRPWAMDLERGLLLSADHGPTLREWRGGSRSLVAHEQLLASYAGSAAPHRTAGRRAAGRGRPRPPADRPARCARPADRRVRGGRGPGSVVAGRHPPVAGARVRSTRIGAPSSMRTASPRPSSTTTCTTPTPSRCWTRRERLVDVVVFDFGDAVVSHPFTSLLAALRSAAHHLDLAPGSAGLARLRDAYLESVDDRARPRGPGPRRRVGRARRHGEPGRRLAASPGRGAASAPETSPTPCRAGCWRSWSRRCSDGRPSRPTASEAVSRPSARCRRWRPAAPGRPERESRPGL